MRLALVLLAAALPAAATATEPKASAKQEPAKPAAAKPKDVAADINAPRADAHKLAFEAREGTWMSLDVSPDGRTLAFDLLGDLYTLPIAGGEARALTSGPAFDSQPRFSPDGKTIAFTSDRSGIENLWLVDAGGQNPRALTQETDAYVRTPAWTPDGSYVLARKVDGKRAGIPPVELWLYHREGGSGFKLTNGECARAAPSPSGRTDSSRAWASTGSCGRWRGGASDKSTQPGGHAGVQG